MTSIRLYLFILIGFAISTTPYANAGTKVDRETVLRACAVEFGAPLDPNNNLFEIDRYFVLEAKFDEVGNLSQLGVLPKHWFSDEHPEWEQREDVGEYNVIEYKSLVVRLDRIRPKGRLLKQAKMPVVSATLAKCRDHYERAVVETGDVVDDERSEDAPRAIKYFIVYFTANKSRQ